MPSANFCDLGRGVAIPFSNFSQILPRHAIQPINGLAVIARRYQQFVERTPVITPVDVEADALPQFALVNFSPPPFVENALVAGKNGLHSQHHWPIPR